MGCDHHTTSSRILVALWAAAAAKFVPELRFGTWHDGRTVPGMQGTGSIRETIQELKVLLDTARARMATESRELSAEREQMLLQTGRVLELRIQDAELAQAVAAGGLLVLIEAAAALLRLGLHLRRGRGRWIVR